MGISAGLPQKHHSLDRIMDIGGVDLDVEQMPLHIRHNMALAALHFFPPINAAIFGSTCCFNALAIDQTVGRWPFSPQFIAVLVL